MKYNLFLSGILLIFTALVSSCDNAEGEEFTPSIIGIVITVIFSVAVIFFFLFRKQSKRKGDDNPKS